MKKLMVIAALLVYMTGSAWAAAEWNFYGSARVSTFYSEYKNNPFIAGTPDTDNFEMDNNGNARIGANIKVSDTLTARFEHGAKSGSANIRILWGEWNFGAGSLGIGKNYTPLLMPYSNQVYNIFYKEDGDTNMSLFGMLYGKREAQVRLKFGNFQVALVQPRTRVYCAPTGLGSGAPYYLMLDQSSTEVKLPNIQAKYKFEFDMGHVNLAAGYQTYDLLDAGESYDVTSWVLALGGRLNVGKAYFKGNVWGGTNVGNLADILVSGSITSTVASVSSGDNLDGAGLGFARWSDGTMVGFGQPARGLTDNDALAGLIVAGYEIRKGLYVEAGYGYTRTELDVVGSEKDDAATWYVQSTIFLAPGVFITPEVGGLDGKQTGDPEIFYAGIKWQINF
ncbi:MAG: hypothetical protein HUN05_11635 [Desulfobacter sp.]|nr:MAG: hypothetical protein HUN05_11635 [Desulfobacter sp.]